MEKYAWIFTLEFQLLVGVIGMFVHFLKKKVMGETLTAIGAFFKDNFKSTIVAVISTIIGVVAYYFTLSVDAINDPMAAFGIGYTFDSVFNKWDGK